MVRGDFTVEKRKHHPLLPRGMEDRRGRGSRQRMSGPTGRRMNLILFISHQSTSTMITVHIREKSTERYKIICKQ